MKRLFALLILWLAACAGFAAQDESPLKVGVLAYRPEPQTMAQWQPVAAYLEKTLGRRVELTVHDHAELGAAAAQRAVDVVITTANHFILLQQTTGVSAPLATLVSREGGHELSAYGGAIFVRGDRDDIASLADLSGKRIAAASLDAFGGYQMQAAALLEAGQPLPSGDRLLLTGQPHDRVVEAVLAGRADAGFVRAGVLEWLAHDGKLDPRRVKVINRQNFPAFPYPVSTRLYPEWPVAVMPQVDERLASRLAAALFLMPREQTGAGAATVAGFTTPANYDGVETLLRRLRLPPFDQAPEITLSDLWRRYASWIATLAGLLLLLAATSAGLVIMYRRSQRSLADLERLTEKEKLILTSLAEGVYGVDTQGNCIFINPRALAMLGFAESEVIGRDVHHLFHQHREDESPYPVDSCPVELALRDGMKRELEDMFIRRDGSRLPVSLGVSAMRHDGDAIVGAVVVFQDITERKQAEQQRLAHLHFLESMDRVNRAIAGTNDLEKMMSDVLDVVLTTFEGDRAFLMYPCDPEAAAWRVPMERNRPEYPGVRVMMDELPMDPDVARTLGLLLASDAPVKFGPGTSNPLPADVSERYGFKCFMSMAIRPKVGKPWQFGIHQCSYARTWTAEEERLLQEIGRRLADGLTTLLAYRDLKDSQGKLEEAQRIAHIGYWDRDFAARRITLSDESCRIFGLSPEEFHLSLDQWHERWLELIHPDDRDGIADVLAQVLQGAVPYNVDYRVVRPDGELRFIHSEAAVTWDKSGQPVRMLGMMQDITERKEAEEEVRRLNQELEQRVAARTAELQAANRELETFTYSVSHDLRLPLRTIDGFLGLLKKRISTTLDDESRRFMATISEAALRMARLIDDLLSFSRSGRFEMNKVPVDLGALVQEVVRELEPAALGRLVEWRVGELPVVTGDHAMLRVALGNLISNALKFTQPRERAEIEIGYQPGAEGEIIVYVRDNGVGFDMQYADKLFRVFERLHGVDEFKGSGIGLANVRRVIARHGGRTWAEGKVDGGATFYFALPQPPGKGLAGERQ